MSSKCPRCLKRIARTHSLFGILPCFICIGKDRKDRKISKAPEFVTQTQQTRIQEQRDRYEADMLPAYTHDGLPSADFARAHPEKAKELFDDYARITGKDIVL